jgi:pectate lyase
MKKIFSLSLFLLSIVGLQAQNYYMAAPEGFGEGTTGGGNATPVTVTTYADLMTKITASTPQVILVKDTIVIPSGGRIDDVITNKTVIGLPGARLVNSNQTPNGAGILYLKNGSSNVILRNLIFEGPGAYDIDGNDNLTADGCTKLWVDHCEFQDGQDGNFDNKGKTDNVTISWCKFTYLKPPVPGGSGGTDDHRFTNLVGSGASDAPSDGHFSITFQYCYWADGCRERMPRARNAELHILNCYYNTSVSGSVALGLGGGSNNLTCYVENTNFADVGQVYKNYSGDGGTVSLAFSGCLHGVSDVGTVTKPGYDYTVLPVIYLADFIPDSSCGAGATLQVTPEGVISTTCEAAIMYTLTTETSGTGTGTVTLDPIGGTYVEGSEVSVTAIPEDGSIFAGWSGATSGIKNPTSITITENTSITADFTDATGIQSSLALDVKCYPTVFDNTVNIDFGNANAGTANISIYSMSGIKVYTLPNREVANMHLELDLGHFSEGIYFCTIQINNTVTTWKLIKK